MLMILGAGRADSAGVLIIPVYPVWGRAGMAKALFST
jgi:hypothetical protein